MYNMYNIIHIIHNWSTEQFMAQYYLPKDSVEWLSICIFKIF